MGLLPTHTRYRESVDLGRSSADVDANVFIESSGGGQGGSFTQEPSPGLGYRGGLSSRDDLHVILRVSTGKRIAV